MAKERRLLCTGNSEKTECENKKSCELYWNWRTAVIDANANDDYINVDTCAGNRVFPFTNFRQEKTF